MKIKQIIEAKYDQAYREKPDFKPYRPQTNDRFHQRLYTFFTPKGEGLHSFVQKRNPIHKAIENALHRGEETTYQDYSEINHPATVYTGAIDQEFKLKDEYVAFTVAEYNYRQQIVGLILRHKNNKISSMAAIKSTGGKIRPFNQADFLDIKFYKDVD